MLVEVHYKCNADAHPYLKIILLYNKGLSVRVSFLALMLYKV